MSFGVSGVTRVFPSVRVDGHTRSSPQVRSLGVLTCLAGVGDPSPGSSFLTRPCRRPRWKREEGDRSPPGSFCVCYGHGIPPDLSSLDRTCDTTLVIPVQTGTLVHTVPSSHCRRTPVRLEHDQFIVSYFSSFLRCVYPWYSEVVPIYSDINGEESGVSEEVFSKDLLCLSSRL